jgi:hypothetical protein
MKVSFSKSAIAVLTFAFAIRLAATLAVPVINLDGIFYINQAKALVQGSIAEDLTCLLGFLSLNSILIAFVSFFLPSWIIAAKTVSLFCGWAILLSVYLIAKRFFEERICILLLLLFSLIPVLVNSSVEIIRDPVAWMFFAFALLLFIRDQEKNSLAGLFFCGGLFLLASWARGEFFLLYLASGLFLLITRHPHRIRITAFLSLFAPLAIVVLLAMHVDLFSQIHQYLRKPPPIDTETAKGLLGLYGGLQEQTRLLATNLPGDGAVFALKNFLPEAANLLWLVAFGMIVTHLCEAVFYFYLPLFLTGLPLINKAIRTDLRLRYFLWMTMVAFLLVYAQVINVWVLEYRWLGPIILSAAIFAGYGIQRLDLALREKLHLSPKVAAILLGGLIILPGAAKLLRQNDNHQVIFLEIAKTIHNEQRGNRGPVHIAATEKIGHPRALIAFYANLALPQAVCINDDPIITQKDIENPTTFVAKLKNKDTQYFLIDESCKMENESGNRQLHLSQVAKQLGEWHHNKTGKIILYRLKDVSSPLQY